MQKNLTIICKELESVRDILIECGQTLSKNGDYSNVSLNELASLYEKIENGLIGFNITSEAVSKILKEEETKYVGPFENIGNLLESQLLNIINDIYNKNPKHDLVRQFKDSLWNSKIKDKNYYNQLFELTTIDLKNRENFYDFLQEH